METLSSKKRVFISIGLMVVMLFVLSTARRFAYPFLPVFMEDFGLTAFAATILVACTQIPAVIGVLWGPLGDKYGYRRMMTVGILVIVAGFLGFVIYQSYLTLLIALFAAGLGKNIYDPNGQACANNSVSRPYRGLVTGVLETGWAMSTLIGVPMVTLLIVSFGWRAPFLTLALAALIALGVLRLVIPAEKPRYVEVNVWQNYKLAFQSLFKSKPILGLALFFICVGYANDSIFVVYSRWLDTSFGMGYVAVGIGTAIIGVAELCGELTTAFLAEKVGYRRLFIIALVFIILSTALLTILGITPSLAWTLLFCCFFGAEALIVTGFAFSQEFMPENKGTILSLSFTATNVGRILGILAGSGFWALGGMELVSAAGTIALVLALGFMAFMAFKFKPTE